MPRRLGENWQLWGGVEFGWEKLKAKTEERSLPLHSWGEWRAAADAMEHRMQAEAPREAEGCSKDASNWEFQTHHGQRCRLNVCLWHSVKLPNFTPSQGYTINPTIMNDMRHSRLVRMDLRLIHWHWCCWVSVPCWQLKEGGWEVSPPALQVTAKWGSIFLMWSFPRTSIAFCSPGGSRAGSLPW